MMHRHRRSRLAALAAGVGTTVAIAALGSASSAMAVTCASPGYASGSSLQNIAQQSIWLTPTGWGAHTACSSLPSVTYSGTSSGAGLNEFGNDINAVLAPKEDETADKSATGYKDKAGEVLDWYVGSDDPPEQGELTEAEIASSGSSAKATLEEITIPVAQAPVAVILSLPTGCTIEEKGSLNIDGKDLVELWEGTNPAEPSDNDPGGIPALGGYGADTWGSFLTQVGYTKTAGTPGAEEFHDAGGSTGCEQAITLQARSSYSGTTYAFKHYLSVDNDELFYNASSHLYSTQNAWTGLISDAPAWPAPVTTTGNGKGSQEVQDTAKNPGSVGYANTSDAVSASNGGFTSEATPSTFGSSASHQIVYADVQNNVGTVTIDEAEKITPPARTYAGPIETGTQIGNCETDLLLPAEKSPPYSYTDSWRGISAEDPNIGVDDTSANWYPICALTYDLVWKHYNAAKLFTGTEAEQIANSVKDLMTYITGEFGQAAIKADDYTGIPTASAWKSHVKLGIEAIGG
jgi:PBP superfamily domain